MVTTFNLSQAAPTDPVDRFFEDEKTQQAVVSESSGALDSDTLQDSGVVLHDAITVSREEIEVIETETAVTFNEVFVENSQRLEIEESAEQATMQKSSLTSSVHNIPFYSQFDDVSDPAWQKQACGVVSLAMIIDHYKPGTVTVDGLLQEGINSGAYLNSAGWIHRGLVDLAVNYGLSGNTYDYAHQSMDSAFAKLEASLAEGPVIASVYYTFTPGHPIPHLVVLNGIEGNTIYYNDPAEPSGGGTISIDDFKPAWKKRFIEIRKNI